MASLGLLERALDIRVLYQRILSTNIANAETPGYKEKEIDFRTELDRRVAGADEIEVGQKDVSEGVSSADGNTVSMEGQIVKMTENTLMFNSIIQLINKKFSMIRYAIGEGRK